MSDTAIDRGLIVTDEAELRKFWYPVAQGDAVGGKPVQRRLLGETLVIWRPSPESTPSVAADRCLHRDALLSRGWLKGETLVCPYHGWEYGPRGDCLSIPHLGPAVVMPSRAKLITYEIAEQWGWVWVKLEPSEHPLPMSGLLPDDDDGWRVIHEPESDWDCHPFALIDNNLDTTHIPFVHQNSFGGEPEVDGPLPEVTSTEDILRTKLSVAVEARPGEIGATVRHLEQEVLMPLLLINRITYPDGTIQIMAKAATPVGNVETHQLQVVWRNDTEEQRPASDIIEFDGVAWREDHGLLAGTWPEFHLDVRRNVHLRNDRASVEYRRHIERILRPKTGADA